MRNYRSDTAAAAATSRKICFPFHSIARRVYFTADHRHHVGRINICQRYYDHATLHFLERSLSRTVTPADVLLKFLKLCVSDARRRRFCVYLNFQEALRLTGRVFTVKMLSEKKEGELVDGVTYTRALYK